MIPIHDYVVLELIKKEDLPVGSTVYKVDEDEPSLSVGIVRAVSDMEVEEGNSIWFTKEDIGKKVLFKRYGFDEFDGKLIGKIENVIAILD